MKIIPVFANNNLHTFQKGTSNKPKKSKHLRIRIIYLRRGLNIKKNVIFSNMVIHTHKALFYKIRFVC